MSSPTSSTETISVSQGAHSPAPLPSARVANLSASFASIAEQFAHASSLIALGPSSGLSGSYTPQPQPQMDLSGFPERLQAIEDAQAVLREEINSIKIQLQQTPSIEEIGPKPADLEKRVAEILDTMKLDQERLYARLHNATVTVSKMPIMAPPTAAGKAPPNFPATKGEFEHLTKERYEAILKAYGQPVKGDTHARREALRVFLGLPAAT
ncbi:hypothetical protein EW146_g2166 [Bondarzewia mesenterica]|uniref:Uncharacterized protein n=1 Tax=Bondarzewia mesenterica TaxID=1095465 RepID=A0A4S4M1E4_9AGAM|nr:hypothetical protein EW146_g2166 [Bondarzewia mesenterica]